MVIEIGYVSLASVILVLNLSSTFNYSNIISGININFRIYHGL